MVNYEVLFWLETTKKAFTKIIPGHISLMLFIAVKGCKRQLILSQSTSISISRYHHLLLSQDPMAPHCTTSAMCKRPADLVSGVVVSWWQFTKKLPFWDGDSWPFEKIRPLTSNQGIKYGHFESLGAWFFCGFLPYRSVSLQGVDDVSFTMTFFLEIRNFDFRVSKFWGDFNSIACMYQLKDGHIMLCINIGSLHIHAPLLENSGPASSGNRHAMGTAPIISRHTTNHSRMMWFPKCLGASLTSYGMYDLSWC